MKQFRSIITASRQPNCNCARVMPSSQLKPRMAPMKIAAPTSIQAICPLMRKPLSKRYHPDNNPATMHCPTTTVRAIQPIIRPLSPKSSVGIFHTPKASSSPPITNMATCMTFCSLIGTNSQVKISLTDTIVVSRKCFIWLQLPVPSWSCRRVCTGGRRFASSRL